MTHYRCNPPYVTISNRLIFELLISTFCCLPSSEGKLNANVCRCKNCLLLQKSFLPILSFIFPNILFSQVDILLTSFVKRSVILSLHYICEISTILLNWMIFFNLEMTTIDSSMLKLNKIHNNTDVTVTIIVTVPITLITLVVLVAFLCKKYTEDYNLFCFYLFSYSLIVFFFNRVVIMPHLDKGQTPICRKCRC